MTTQEAISKYVKEQLPKIAELYTWKINDSMIPKGVQLSGDNMFEKNLSLKLSLNKEPKFKLSKYITQSLFKGSNKPSGSPYQVQEAKTHI